MSSRDLGYFRVVWGGEDNISCPLVAYTFQSYDDFTDMMSWVHVGALGHSEYRCTENDSFIWGWPTLLKSQNFVQEEVIKWAYSSIYLALIAVVMAVWMLSWSEFCWPQRKSWSKADLSSLMTLTVYLSVMCKNH